jgi:hypothetical protein
MSDVRRHEVFRLPGGSAALWPIAGQILRLLLLGFLAVGGTAMTIGGRGRPALAGEGRRHRHRKRRCSQRPHSQLPPRAGGLDRFEAAPAQLLHHHARG